MIANTKGGTALLVVISMLAGVGIYNLAINIGWVDVAIPYKSTPGPSSAEYMIEPKVRGR